MTDRGAETKKARRGLQLSATGNGNSHMEDSTQIWISASLNAGRIIHLPTPRPAPEQPGTLMQQLQVAELAGQNPWGFVDHQDAYQAARRTILQHARRATL